MPTPRQRDLVQHLFISHVEELRAFVTAFMPDPDVAEEVIHATFTAVTKRAGEYAPEQPFNTWLQSIARENVVLLAEKASAESRPFSADVIEVLGPGRTTTNLTPERLKVLEECIMALAPQTRRLVQLRYRQAMRPAEVAEVMGWTAASVRVALSRARTVLRDCVERKMAAVREG